MPTYKCDQCDQQITSGATVAELRCSCGGSMTTATPGGRVFTPRTVGRFAIAVTRWMAAGRPVRTADQVDRLLATKCNPPGAPCPQFDGSTCKVCSCPINAGVEPLQNKLAMATERCPLGKFEAAHKGDAPRWIGDVERVRAAIALSAICAGLKSRSCWINGCAVCSVPAPSACRSCSRRSSAAHCGRGSIPCCRCCVGGSRPECHWHVASASCQLPKAAYGRLSGTCQPCFSSRGLPCHPVQGHPVQGHPLPGHPLPGHPHLTLKAPLPHSLRTLTPRRSAK